MSEQELDNLEEYCNKQIELLRISHIPMLETEKEKSGADIAFRLVRTEITRLKLSSPPEAVGEDLGKAIIEIRGLRDFHRKQEAHSRNILGDTEDAVMHARMANVIDQCLKAVLKLSSPPEAMGDAVEFAEWLRTFEPLTKENNQWVLESQVSTETLYKRFRTWKNTYYPESSPEAVNEMESVRLFFQEILDCMDDHIPKIVALRAIYLNKSQVEKFKRYANGEFLSSPSSVVGESPTTEKEALERADDILDGTQNYLRGATRYKHIRDLIRKRLDEIAGGDKSSPSVVGEAEKLWEQRLDVLRKE